MSLQKFATIDTVVYVGMTREYVKKAFFPLFRNYFHMTLIPHNQIKIPCEETNVGVFRCKLRHYIMEETEKLYTNDVNLMHEEFDFHYEL